MYFFFLGSGVSELAADAVAPLPPAPAHSRSAGVSVNGVSSRRAECEQVVDGLPLDLVAGVFAGALAALTTY